MEAKNSSDDGHFAVDIVPKSGAVIMRMHGEIDGFAGEEINIAYSEADAHDPQVIVLDFTEVGYINSTGIALIVGILARARAAKRRLIACGLSEHYVEIFTITRLSDFMNLFPDAESAVEAGRNDSREDDERR